MHSLAMELSPKHSGNPDATAPQDARPAASAQAQPAAKPQPSAGATPSAPEANASSAQALPPADARLQHALDELAKAIAARNFDAICGAYQALRLASPGATFKDMLHRVEQTIGKEAFTHIVSAYSHRSCFMCDAGLGQCDSCEGAGRTAAGKACPHCDGFGAQPCGFCRGTGWAERELVPAELRTVVLELQLRHLHAEVDKFRHQAAKVVPGRFARFTPDQRRTLGNWLMRLLARLVDVAHMARDGQAPTLQPPARHEFQTAAEQVETIIRQLAEANRQAP